MEESRKHGKNTVTGIDRISSLPDEVLIRILSFVRTMQAVRTCILSKRWRNIWASVPVLNLNFDDFWIEEIIEEPGQYNDIVDEFVICWLDNREPAPLDLFLYRDTYNQLRNELHWLDHVEPKLPKGISVLVYSLFGFDSMLSSTSLQHLELHLINYGHRAHLPELHLPSLKTLSVSSNYYSLLIDNDSLDCPVLEKIVIFYCVIHISEISSSVLKEIEIYNTVHGDDDLLHISCPGLISLDILNTRISLENMALPSLVNANIISDGCDMKLATFSNTTCLKLISDDWDTKEQLEKNISTCRTFHNLKRLEIGKWDMWNDFDLVACFLKKSPLLEKLTLHLPKHNEDHTEEESRQELSRDALFQRDYLDMVEINSAKNDMVLVGELVKILGAHVKTIGKIVII